MGPPIRNEAQGLTFLRIPTAGVESRVLTVGASGTPIVLLHGLSGHSDLWLPVLPALRAEHRVFAADMIGRGYTDLPADFTTGTAYELMFRQAVDLLDELDLEDVTLVGSSLGALVAGHAALRTDRVSRLVLVGSGTVANSPGQLRDSTGQSRRGLSALREPITLTQVREHMNTLVPRELELLPEFLYTRLMIYSNPTVRRNIDVIGTLLAEHPPSGENNFADRADEVRQPTLLIWGSEDPRADPERARALAERMKSARLVTIPGSGHFPFLERPERFAELVLAFADHGLKAGG